MTKSKLLSSVMEVCVQLFLFLFFIMGEIRVASLNINGAREQKKRAVLFETIKQKKFDIVFVQETHSDALNAVDWAREFDGLSVLSHNRCVECS